MIFWSCDMFINLYLIRNYLRIEYNFTDIFICLFLLEYEIITFAGFSHRHNLFHEMRFPSDLIYEKFRLMFFHFFLCTRVCVGVYVINELSHRYVLSMKSCNSEKMKLLFNCPYIKIFD